MPTIIAYPSWVWDYNDPNISYDDSMVAYDFIVGGSIVNVDSELEWILKWLPHLISVIDIEDELRYSFWRRLLTEIGIDSVPEYLYKRPVSRKLKVYSWRHRSEWWNAKALYWV